MPPHTSHLLQPLDVGVFGPLKRAYGKLVEGMMVAGNNHIDKEDFLLYPPACERVFIQKNIYSGYAGAGLKPLNEDQVLEKITFQLRTPTPPPLLEGSISSAFKPLRILGNWIKRSTAYREVFRKESFLAGRPRHLNVRSHLNVRFFKISTTF
jgi:hypothetical protein